MSFALPSVKPKPSIASDFGFKQGTFGVPDLLTYGLASARSVVDAAHPLQQAELNREKNTDQLNMRVLRNTQGLHAPLRIAMELNMAKKVGRLPFLTSSNVMYDSLTGRDIQIGPEDVFNLPEFEESAGQPHAVMERSLGIL